MQALPRFTPSWQAALNPVLVQRLMRPAQQAGLIRTQQAQALLTRHQKMTAGLPLAALAQRGGAIFDAATGQVPIVYAQPAAMGDASAVNTMPATPTEVHIHPTLPIANPLRPQGASTTPASSPTTVIQRKMMPGAAPALAVQKTTSPGAQSSAPTVVPAPAATLASSAATFMPTLQQGVETTPNPQSPGALPVVQPAFVWADGAAVNNASPAAASALPMIRIIPINVEFDKRNGPGPMPLTSILPALAQTPSAQTHSTLLVVREQPALERMPHPSALMQPAQATVPMQLPYIETPQPQSAPNLAFNETPREQASPQRNSLTQPAQNHPIPSSSHHAINGLTPQPAQLNMDEIVDKVHRKFLRRLASEAERRGVR